MSVLVPPALVACVLLALAGAQKLLDPTMTVGALRALHLPSSPALVRAGSVAELGLGVVALVAGGSGVWWAICCSYLAFGAFVLAALRSGTMIGSCGCFGREETPPHWSHLVLNGALAGISAVVAVAAPKAPLDALTAHPAEGVVVAAFAALAVLLLHAAFVELPRTLQAIADAASARTVSTGP